MDQPFLSVVVPVYNGGEAFERSLQAIGRSSFADYELIVVDDGSTDGSGEVALRHGARLLATGRRSGPGAARNLGAREARGEYLCFIDADCEVAPDTLLNMARALRSEGGDLAVFGSYDDSPSATNVVGRFKNLFHYYIHQTSGREASTFWAGCGGVRRDAFLRVGGFDAARYSRPSIEDIELGTRLRASGTRIRLNPEIQVKHHKAWTLGTLLRTDLLDRAIPWTRLMLSGGGLQDDLNIRLHHRLSAVAVFGFAAAVTAALFEPRWLLAASGVGAVLLWLNRDLYAFFLRREGWKMTLAAIPLHWLYYAYSAVGFGCGALLHLVDRFRSWSRARLSRIHPLG